MKINFLKKKEFEIKYNFNCKENLFFNKSFISREVISKIKTNNLIKISNIQELLVNLRKFIILLIKNANIN
jgi:hypothetical protein